MGADYYEAALLLQLQPARVLDIVYPMYLKLSELVIRLL